MTTCNRCCIKRKLNNLLNNRSNSSNNSRYRNRSNSCSLSSNRITRLSISIQRARTKSETNSHASALSTTRKTCILRTLATSNRQNSTRSRGAISKLLPLSRVREKSLHSCVNARRKQHTILSRLRLRTICPLLLLLLARIRNRLADCNKRTANRIQVLFALRFLLLAFSALDFLLWLCETLEL